jgi:hypothetical protein
MLAFLAPNDQPDVGGGSIAECHRRAGSDFVLISVNRQKGSVVEVCQSTWGVGHDTWLFVISVRSEAGSMEVVAVGGDFGDVL